MSTNPSAASEPHDRGAAIRRLRWVIWASALVVGVGLGVALAVLREHPAAGAAADAEPVATWASGVRRAPAFLLHDQSGRTITLGSFHGRPVILTFIDPLCRNFCPREASVLSEADAKLGSDAPTIVSVSVNPWADTTQNFRLDALRWHLAPSWLWGAGTFPQLARVWKPYEIGVDVTTKKIAGVTIREITHTAATYLIDGNGYERALLLYPFTTAQVLAATRNLLAGEA